MSVQYAQTLPHEKSPAQRTTGSDAAWAGVSHHFVATTYEQTFAPTKPPLTTKGNDHKAPIRPHEKPPAQLQTGSRQSLAVERGAPSVYLSGDVTKVIQTTTAVAGRRMT